MLKLRQLLEQEKVNFMKPHGICLLVSVLLMLASAIYPFFTKLNLGTDFRSGVEIEFSTKKPLTITEVRSLLSQVSGNVEVKEVDKSSLTKNKEEVAASLGKSFIILATTDQGTVEQISNSIKNTIAYQIDSEAVFTKIEATGPTITKQYVQQAIIGIAISLIFMVIYMSIRFNIYFAIPAIFALVHDSLISFGFAVAIGLKIDFNLVAALLTIIGYSLNDTVVIYDRIRTNMSKYRGEGMFNIINRSVNQVFWRSILTSFTVMLSLIPIVLIVKESLINFSATMLFGVIIGSYSTIYIAAPTLIYLINSKPRPKLQKT